MTETGFVLSLAILAYAYLFYPLLLGVLPTIKQTAPAQSRGPHDWPTASIIVSAYNEESSIRGRVRNFLEGRYPGWSELLIVSDGSTDATADEAVAIASERVRVFVRPQRRGKAAALDFGVAHARGQILAFSDASSVFHPDALTNLVRRFADDDIGLVTGKVKAYGSEIVGVYHRYERFLERREADTGVLASAHGCIYAMRRELWRRHDPALVDDFLAPILVSLSAKRAVAAPDAICVEDFPAGAQFNRQVRMVALAALTLHRLLPELVRSRRYRSLLVLVSHKLLRWLTLVWLTLLALTTFWLMPLGGIYAVAAAVQGVFWTVVALGALAHRRGVLSPITFAYQFVAMNTAALVGFCRFIGGRPPIIWDTPKADQA